VKFLNLTGYLFFKLESPESLRDLLLPAARRLGLRGTIILASEGINLSLAGEEGPLRAFVQEMSAHGVPEFELKESYSQIQPHKRMLVKVRPEIVTLRFEGVDPAAVPAPYIEAKELKVWLDEDRDFLLLDTRKAFEFEMGSFDRAVNLGGKHFSEFPKEVESLSKEWRQKPVVTFCTGGIRCEKGAPMMQLKGFERVYQLKGGILKYFEECGGDHWRGQCFVFDHRAAVNPDLSPVEGVECRTCGQAFQFSEQPKHINGLEMICTTCHSEAIARKRA